MRILRATPDELRLWRTNDEDIRNKLKAGWLEQTGGESFRLMSSNGRFMGTVRAENSQAEPQYNGVSPEACACKDLQGTPAGMHHPICKNRELWEAYRGGALPVPGMQSGLGVQLMQVQKPQPQASGVVHHQIAKKIDIHTPPISTAHEGKARAPAVMQPVKQHVRPVLPVVPVLTSPETCKCTQFTKGLNHDQKQHHPICEFFEKWQAAHPTPAAPAGPPKAETREVKNLSERDSIPASFRTQDMLVRCLENDGTYQLVGGVTNTHWFSVVIDSAQNIPIGQTDVGNLDIKSETQEVVEQVLAEDAARKPLGDIALTMSPASSYDCVLVDLNTRAIMREATIEEITEAAAEEEKSGAPTVVVDETMYAVLKRSEVQSALPSP